MASFVDEIHIHEPGQSISSAPPVMMGNQVGDSFCQGPRPLGRRPEGEVTPHVRRVNVPVDVVVTARGVWWERTRDKR